MMCRVSIVYFFHLFSVFSHVSPRFPPLPTLACSTAGHPGCWTNFAVESGILGTYRLRVKVRCFAPLVFDMKSRAATRTWALALYAAAFCRAAGTVQSQNV